MESPALRKSLGQHHLRDPALCRPVIDFLAPGGDLDGGMVIEIGLGGGVLTRALLAAGARVRAWELDAAWAFACARDFTGRERLEIIVGDALEFPWQRLTTPFSVAGNLPYNVATPLIDRVLGAGESLGRAAFLVQLEVAQRLVAEPGSKVYGALSVLTQARAEARILGRVSAGSFVPPPKVESAFVGLRPRSPAPTPDRIEALRAVVYAAFGQRRKTLRNALATRWTKAQATAAIAAAGLPSEVRAEQLSLADFEALLNLLQSV